MVRRIGIWLLVVAGGIAPLTPTNAAPARPSLTVVGNRTAYADITLAHRADLDLSHATLTGGGRFVGLYVETLDKPVADRSEPGARFGIVRIRDYHPTGEAAPTLMLGDAWLAAGRYRVYLVADGAATVRVPLSGSPTLKVRAVRPTEAAAVVAPDILVNQLEANNRQALRVTGRRSISFSSITVGRFRAFAGQIAACMALPGQDCGTATARGADGTYTGWFVSPLLEREFMFTLGYEAGVLPAGSYDAVQQAVNAATLQLAVGAAFTLALR